MRILMPAALCLLWGCEPIDETELCESGLRETWTSSVPGPSGAVVNLETDQCVRVGWSWADCADGNEPHCLRFFGPNQPPVTPVEYVFGDFVFTQAIGHIQVTRPAILGNNVSLEAGLLAARDELLPLGYEVGPLEPTAAIDEHPGYRMRVSCEHPEVDPGCPFTWEYLLIDLSSSYPDLYADLTMAHAAWVDASDATVEYPAPFDEYHQMIDSMHLTVLN